jgi:hypothetical protein
MKKLYSSWCRYCGCSLTKRPVKEGNSCIKCQLQRARTYTSKYKQNEREKKHKKKQDKKRSR